MEVEHVLGPDLASELADRLEERQRLDVADGPPISLITTSAGAAFGRARMRRLISFVMCGTLHRGPQELALPLLRSAASPIAPALSLMPTTGSRR